MDGGLVLEEATQNRLELGNPKQQESTQTRAAPRLEAGGAGPWLAAERGAAAEGEIRMSERTCCELDEWMKPELIFSLTVLEGAKEERADRP